MIGKYLSYNFSLGYNDFLQALSDVTRAKGMQEVAQKTGLGRESLYKALKLNSKPRMETIYKVLQALNIKLELVPNLRNCDI